MTVTLKLKSEGGNGGALKVYCSTEVAAAAGEQEGGDGDAPDVGLGLTPIESLTPDLEALIASGEMTREEARAIAIGGDDKQGEGKQ